MLAVVGPVRFEPAPALLHRRINGHVPIAGSWPRRQEATPALRSLQSVRATTKPDRWLGPDKFWHFSASFATVGASYHLCKNRLNCDAPIPASVALGGTAALGITKEFCDLAGPDRHFSYKDLVADLVGIAFGYLVFIHDF